MAPFAFKTLYLFLALVVLPQVLAGPACAYRNRGKPDCVRKCKGHWGYGRNCMGHDKWGFVINSCRDESTDPDSALSTACGLDKTITSDPASIPTDSSPSSSNEPPPPVTDSTPTPSKNPPDFSPSSTSTSSNTSSSTPTTTSTSIPPPPSSSPPSGTLSPPNDVTEKPSPTSSSDEPSTPPAGPSPTPNTSGTDDFRKAALTEHNNYRALRGASPLIWSEDLAVAAKSWVSRCGVKHSNGTVGGYGENLAAGAGPYTITDAVRGWTVDEEGGYNPETLSGLHFSQVVWKNTAELGCANNICPPDGTFPVEYGNYTLIACEYNPPGNVIGQFDQNVQV